MTNQSDDLVAKLNSWGGHYDLAPDIARGCRKAAAEITRLRAACEGYEREAEEAEHQLGGVADSINALQAQLSTARREGWNAGLKRAANTAETYGRGRSRHEYGTTNIAQAIRNVPYEDDSGHREPTEADMRAFGASDAACYRWPDDTPEHKALRAAYIEGAAATGHREQSPLGKVTVPLEPIEEMINATKEALASIESALMLARVHGFNLVWKDGKPPLYHAYKAMLAAAPLGTTTGGTGELVDALLKCVTVFEQLADAGNYPLPLLENGGWAFAIKAIENATGRKGIVRVSALTHPKATQGEKE